MDDKKTKTDEIRLKVDDEPDQSAEIAAVEVTFLREIVATEKGISNEQTPDFEPVVTTPETETAGFALAADSKLTTIEPDQITAAAGKVLQAENEFPDLGDRFQVIEFVGAGGMGRVYKVLDKTLDKTFAVKLLRSELASDAQAVQRFRMECQAVSKLTHLNIVSVYDFHITPSGIPFILMDFVDGLNLQVLLKQDGALEPTRARKIMEQISDAVNHAHSQGVIHRDLKPSNIIVKQKETGEDVAVVLDFGIAAVLEKGLDSGTITRTGELVGSPQYMSPEQLNGETVSKASDIFSLGCLFYELLVGEPVFSESNPVTVIYKRLKEPFPVAALRRLKPPFTSVISACLETSPAERYQSVESFSRDLAEIAHGRPPSNTRALKIDYNKLLLKRFAAFALDGALICLVATVIGAILSPQSTAGFKGASYQFLFPYFCLTPKALPTTIGMVCVVLYYILFEASRLRATPGKIIMKLVVANDRFTKLPALAAILRYASRILYIMAVYYLAVAPINSLGLRPLFPFFLTDSWLISIVLVIGVAWILRPRAQLPHDVLIGTKVVPKSMPKEAVAGVGKNSKRRLASAAIAMVLIPAVCITTLLAHGVWDKTNTNNSDIARYTLQIQTDSKNPRLWKKRGQAYIREKDYDRAVADLTRSIELSGESNDFSVFSDRGYCYNQLEQYTLALPDLLKAIELAPEKNWPYVSLSHAENCLGMYEASKKHATTGIKLSPKGFSDLCWLYNNRAVAEIALGEYSLADSDAERAYLLGGTHHAYYVNKGQALYGLSDYHGSMELASKVLKTDSDNFVAYWILALNSQKLKDTGRALAYIDEAGRGKAAIGFKRRILETRGDILSDAQRYDEAIKSYSMAIELGYYGRDGYEVFQSRGKAYKKIGEDLLAASDFAEATRRKEAAEPVAP